MSDADIMAEAYASDVSGGPHSQLSAMEENGDSAPEKEPQTDAVDMTHTPMSRFGRKLSNPNLVSNAMMNSLRYSHSNKLACRYCGKTFSQAGYIKAHERLHTGEKPFACSVCGKRFSDPSNWKKHERVHSNHSGSQSLSGNGGGEGSNSSSPKTPPIPQPPTPLIKSEMERSQLIRAASSMITSSLQQRMRNGTEMMNSPIMCKLCGKLFSSQSSLSTHKRIHTGERPYTCSSCGKSFTQIGTLRTHERIHTGEKPYICKVCGRTFAQSGSYRMHERRHMTDTIQRCHICYATFTKWQDLQQHMTTHPQMSEAMMEYSPPDLVSPGEHKEDGRASNLSVSESLLLDSESHYQPQSVFQGQLPPFSSIMPFRSPIGTTFAPSFPNPLSMYTSSPISCLPDQPELSLLRPQFFPGMNLSAQMKLSEQTSPGPTPENNEVVSTTSNGQNRKYSTESHNSILASTPEAMADHHKLDLDADTSQTVGGQSYSSDSSSPSPDGVENGGTDETQPLAIERQNLNTRMMPSSSSGRKQRHPMRRCSSSASSDQELPQSTSCLPSALHTNGVKLPTEPNDAEDVALVSYLLWKGKVYKCEHCHIIFDDCTLYLLHNGFHSHDSDPFKCVICKLSCKDRVDFNCHLTSHIK